MAVSYRIDKALGLLVVVGRGAITDQEIGEYAETVAADPDLACVRMELADFRDAEFTVSPAGITRLAGLDRERLASLGEVKRALVVSNDLQYGLVRMYGQYLALAGHQVMPFRDMEEAREWLGVPEQGEDA